MHAYVAHAAGDKTGNAGIIVFQEAFGVNDYIRDICERFARLGLTAIAPELYHRTGDGFEAAYGDFPSVRTHMQNVTAQTIGTDARAAYDWLTAHGGASRVAAVGFCMGGRAAYLSNAELPLEAAISFYGPVSGESMNAASKQHAPVLMFWGGRDEHIPAVTYRALADALTDAGANHTQVVFSNADHGFFCDRRDSYDPSASAQAWELVKAFLRDRGLYTM
jgi:carboxymethylenebutenolidase